MSNNESEQKCGAARVHRCYQHDDYGAVTLVEKYRSLGMFAAIDKDGRTRLVAGAHLGDEVIPDSGMDETRAWAKGYWRAVGNYIRMQGGDAVARQLVEAGKFLEAADLEDRETLRRAGLWRVKNGKIVDTHDGQ